MFSEKMITRSEAANIAKKFKEEGKIIGFTSGSFDLVHAGHVDYLEKAKAKCDVLFIGVNSDASVKMYKGEKRPIVPEQNRLTLIAGLASTDYCFLFPERRNKENILALKPHLYLKAGDYDEKSLTSAKYMEDWGGKAEFLPFIEGESTTSIVEKIIHLYSSEVPSYLEIPTGEKSSCVFLDRDGVINQEIEYLHEPEKFEFIPRALEGIKKLYDAGFKIVVVTTQAGIGLGYFSKEDFYQVNKKMLKGMHQAQIALDKIYFCPHSKNDHCECRKPKSGLFKRAEAECHLDLSRSFMIGDKTSDIQAGMNLGMKTVLMESGHAGNDGEFNVVADFKAKDLVVAADWILTQ